MTRLGAGSLVETFRGSEALATENARLREENARLKMTCHNLVDGSVKFSAKCMQVVHDTQPAIDARTMRQAIMQRLQSLACDH